MKCINNMFAAATVVVASVGFVYAARQDWISDGEVEIAKRMELKPITTQAKNVILFIADGNGPNSNFAARLYAGQQGDGYGEDYQLYHEKFPYLCAAKTYNTNAQTPDSAGTGTALMTGVKTKSGVLGLDETVHRGDCSTLSGAELTTLAMEAKAMGKAVGVVSTARITHATPAATYARSVDRDYETFVPDDCTEQLPIADQLLEAMCGEDAFIDVALGGGRRAFFSNTETDWEGDAGERTDGRDLREEFKVKCKNGQMVEKTQDFYEADFSGNGGKILGLFESSHMDYEYERLVEGDSIQEPSVAHMTERAIEYLQHIAPDAGFFLMVEGGRVDHANHAGTMRVMLEDNLAYQEAVEAADDMTHDEDTLIVSTADHDHALAFNGYCGRGTDILGLCMDIDDFGEEHLVEYVLADDGKPFTVAGYLNGPGSVLLSKGVNQAMVVNGSVCVRPNIIPSETQDYEYMVQSLIPLTEETHGPSDVNVYAKGPYAHLFTGTVEQSYIYHVMKYAYGAEDSEPDSVCASEWESCTDKECCDDAGISCVQPRKGSSYKQCRRDPPTDGCIGHYRQCGGKKWTGSTECCEGMTCHMMNDYYSQCRVE